jgi:DNA-binding PadR family transcriptional regulator
MNSEFHTHQNHPDHHDYTGHSDREPRRFRGGRGFGPGFPGFPGGPDAHGGFGPRGFGPGGFGGPQRKRRGDVRVGILSLLSDGPSNGYGLIKQIAERSGGSWTPSPGSVYPTLQQLVDEDLIEAIGEGKRTEFQLTDAGRTWVAEHTDELAALWAGASEQVQADAGLHESVGKLMGVIHQFRFAATDAQREAAVTALDDTRRALYGILAD